MSDKVKASGELLSSLNRNINKSHHKKPDSQFNQSIDTQAQGSEQFQPKLTTQNNKQETIKVNQKQPITQIKLKTQASRLKTQSIAELPSKDGQARQQTLKTQNKTVRSNLSKAFEINNKKQGFKSQFDIYNNLIAQQEIGQTLHDILAMQIGKLVSEPLAEVVQKIMKQKQDNVYIQFTKSEINYLQSLLNYQKNQPNNAITDIESLLASRQSKTLQKIDNGELYIDLQKAITTKSQIQELTKLDVARLLKIKEGTIRSKLDLLNDKMFEIEALKNSPRDVSPTESLQRYQLEKLEELTDPSNFSLNSEKTKIAHDYVKHLQQQKLLILKNMRQREQKRTQIQKERELELKQADEMRNAAKKQQIQQKVKEYRKKKEQNVFQHQQKSKKVEQFLKQYRKSLPLYKKKEKQFTQIHQRKKNKEFQEKLKAIKQTHRSMSLNEIKEHEQKYLERKSLDQSQKQEEFKMMLKARNATESSKAYFKGFYHDKVKILDQQEKLKFYSLRESTKLKVKRVTEFDEKIRKLHKPKVDPKKKQALQRIIELDELKKKRVKKLFRQVEDQNGQFRMEAYYEQIPEIDHYREGNKYMQIAKSLAKKKKPEQDSRYSEQPHMDQTEEEKIQKNKLNKDEQLQPTDFKVPSPILSQQKSIWRLRSKQLSQMTEGVNPDNFYQIKKSLEVMDDKAKLKQTLLRHKDSDAHELMQEKSMLDDFYLESIKNKIKLLNQ